MSSFLRKYVSVPLLMALLVLSTGCAHIEREGNLETLLATLPIPRVEDPMGDLILDHPVFERNFHITFENNEAIPPALDVVMVEVVREGDDYLFQIRTRGDNLPDLLEEGRHVAQLGVYVDTDVNGVSDFLLITTDKPGFGLVVTPEFEIIYEMEDISIGKDLVTLRIPSHLVGEHFDWSVFSGFSPAEGRYHRTPLDHVFFVPEVDWVHSSDMAFSHPLFTSMKERVNDLVNTGVLSVVLKSKNISCPPATAKTSAWYKKHGLQPIPGTSINGVLMHVEYWPGLNYRTELWCTGYFTRRVEDPKNKGFMAKCPFGCGQNSYTAWRPTGGQPAGLYHTIVDSKTCGVDSTGMPITDHDQDNDHLVDVMRHEFYWAHSKPSYVNRVESCNIERVWGAGPLGGTQKAKRCCPVRPLYSKPDDPPGAINQVSTSCP